MEQLKEGELDCRINIMKIAQFLKAAKYQAGRGNMDLTLHFLNQLTNEFDKAGILSELKKYE